MSPLYRMGAIFHLFQIKIWQYPAQWTQHVWLLTTISPWSENRVEHLCRQWVLEWNVDEIFKKPGTVSPEKSFIRGMLRGQWSHSFTVEPHPEHRWLEGRLIGAISEFLACAVFTFPGRKNDSSDESADQIRTGSQCLTVFPWIPMCKQSFGLPTFLLFYNVVLRYDSTLQESWFGGWECRILPLLVHLFMINRLKVNAF